MVCSDDDGGGGGASEVCLIDLQRGGGQGRGGAECNSDIFIADAVISLAPSLPPPRLVCKEDRNSGRGRPSPSEGAAACLTSHRNSMLLLSSSAAAAETIARDNN